VKRGFTLLEVLITLVLIAGGMTAILMAFSLVTGASRGVEEHEAAVNIAYARMEEIQSISYTELQSSTIDSGTMFAALAGYTVAVTTTKPENPAKVSVTVSWPVKGGTASVALTTLKADN
jgi:prepilin-type N-terminal cleavage/methylation domain-containing protein